MSKNKTTAPVAPSKPHYDPEVVSPAPSVKVSRLVRFVYVPVEGFYAGDAKQWYKNNVDSPEWLSLRKNARLTSFLTNNPLAIVFADLDPVTQNFKVSEISIGGTFLKPAVAKSILPFLPWIDDEKKPAVAAPVEEK